MPAYTNIHLCRSAGRKVQIALSDTFKHSFIPTKYTAFINDESYLYKMTISGRMNLPSGNNHLFGTDQRIRILFQFLAFHLFYSKSEL